jgi:hypothetical protein
VSFPSIGRNRVDRSSAMLLAEAPSEDFMAGGSSNSVGVPRASSLNFRLPGGFRYVRAGQGLMIKCSHNPGRPLHLNVGREHETNKVRIKMRTFVMTRPCEDVKNACPYPRLAGVSM